MPSHIYRAGFTPCLTLPETLSGKRDQRAFYRLRLGLKKGALPSEQKEVNDLGMGAGLRLKLFNQVYLRLEWGFVVGDESITGQGIRSSIFR